MPTLNWIGKDEVVNYHKHVSFLLLGPVLEISIPNPARRVAGGEGITFKRAPYALEV